MAAPRGAEPAAGHPQQAITPSQTMEPSPESPRPRTKEGGDDPPAASSSTAHLARFEFSDLGTKILMVEWHDSGGGDTSAPAMKLNTPVEVLEGQAPPPASSGAVQHPAATSDAWQVSWPGKSTFLPAREAANEAANEGGSPNSPRRVYFLLPPEATIPATVTITRSGRPSLLVKPLPAIFPPGFDAEAGSRGVLHTLWAKKRLSELDREMDAEMRANAESVGLQMALAEKQWIVDNFLQPPPVASVPLSPRSPIPGRLGDKLKGLKLATAPEDLAAGIKANTFTGTNAPSHSLSPLGGDVAVASYSAVSRESGSSSLNAALNSLAVTASTSSKDSEDDLFALPLSPRSPDMKRGPFSALV